jgi:galactose mutarotase-like enzyme
VMDLHLHYELSDDNALVVRHEITAIQGAGVASVTSHGYFNLDGAGAPSIGTHTLEVDANHVIDTTHDGVATGHLVSLDGHALDLLHATPLTVQQPIDHGYLLRAAAGLRRIWPLDGRVDHRAGDAGVHRCAPGCRACAGHRQARSATSALCGGMPGAAVLPECAQLP